MNDIETTSDVETVVSSFYKIVLDDAVLGPVFLNYMEGSLEEHLPKMNRFWGSILLGTADYTGNPIRKHIALNKRIALTQDMFDTWTSLWETTVDSLFKGPVA